MSAVPDNEGWRSSWRASNQRRKYPYAEVGDSFDVHIVTKLLPRDASGNERVQVRCTVCGNEKAALVFNLRKSGGCKRCPRRTNP